MVGLFLIHCAFVFLNSAPFILSLLWTVTLEIIYLGTPYLLLVDHANQVDSRFPVLLRSIVLL
jgi:hypothetical protein